MQRPRSAAEPVPPTRPIPRWTLLAAAVLFFVVCVLALKTVIRAQRILSRVSRSSAASANLAFTLTPLDPSSLQGSGSAFEPVASAPSYTTGAFLGGSLYLAGPAGLTLFAADGSPSHILRTGRELPVAPITTAATGRLRGASEPQLLLATAGAGLLILTANPAGQPAFQHLLPGQAALRDLTSLLPLATGDLLLGTRHSGVLLYNGATITRLRFTLPGLDPAALQVTALAAAGPSAYLVATRDRGLFYLHGGEVEHAGTEDGLPDNDVESLAVSGARAYAGTPVGTAEFSLSAPSFRPTRTLGPGLFAHKLAVDESQLTIGTMDQGIHQVPLDGRAHLRRITLSSTSAPAQRIDAFLASSDALYSLADGTLLRHSGGEWTPALPASPANLTDRNISALAFAPDGTLYIGFFDRGLDLLSPQGAVRHLEDDHLFCINRLALDPVRRTIAAATADGLVLFDAQGTPRQTLTRRDGLISGHVTDIAFTRDGTALATPAGITFLKPGGPESLYAFQGLVNNHVYALAAVAPDRLLAGTLGGLSLLQSQSVERNLTVSNSSLKHNWITALLPAADGNTLVGTYGAGVETLDPTGRFTPIELPAATPRDLIINPNALFATPTHFYAGTLDHGLLVYSIATRTWSVVTAGLPSLNITAFAARAGELYVGTENGLVRIAEATL